MVIAALEQRALEQRTPIGARFDPLDAAYLDDPYPYLTEAREAAPVFYADSIDHWVVTRHREIKQIFRDPPTFSAANANAPLRPPCLTAAKALEEGGWRAVPTLANVDPPAHTRVRRIAKTLTTFDCGYVGMTRVPSSALDRYWSACATVAPISSAISPGTCLYWCCSAFSGSTSLKCRASRRARGTASCSSTAAPLKANR